MKKLLCAAVLCLGGITTPSASQATDQVKISPYELMISLGAVAYVFDVDASLKGAPRTSLEARKERFLVEPGKVVLAFPKNSAYIDGIQHSAILTEDGQWGMVPMRAAGGFSYFLNEATIEQVYDAYKASGAISWVVVTSGFASPDPRIHFSRGEIFQIDTTFESGQPAAIINSSVSFMKTKAREISSLSPQSSQVSSQDGNLFVRLSGTQLGHVEYIGSQVIDFMKAKEEAQGGAWDLFRDHFVELWPKVVKLHAPLRVDCNMTVELKKQKSAEASEKLKASFDSESVIPALKAIGIGISAEVAIEASQKFSSTIDKTIADQSFDVNQFIVVTRDGPKLVSFGLGGDCPSPATAATAPMATTEPMLFPYAIVEGIPETAVNRDVVESMEKNANKKVTWSHESGYLSVTCFHSGFAQIVDHLSNSRGIDERIARFMAARWLRTAPAVGDSCPSS